MRFDVKRQLFARSERVKGIDFHTSEPWVLTTLYSGHVHIWSYETGSIIKTFEVTDVPVRAGRFVARKNWIVTGSDDFQLRVLNYNTAEKVTSLEAHPDYIRAIAVHPTQPFVLTASDDMTCKLFDWERGWKCIQVFEGHSHYVMSIAINPKDTNTFASACLDRTVKIWNLSSSTANFTLEAHETKGVNWVDYYPQSDKPYILTTSDDKTIKCWDYTSKQLIYTLEGHTSNELPIVISGSEDGTVKLWNANTARLEQSLSYGLERAWCVAYQRGKQNIAIGFDEGMVVLTMGREEPAMSMDASGKIIYAKHTDIVTTTIKGVDKDQKDGQQMTLPSKDLGSIEVYPQTLQHSPNGRFVAICGDGEWIIYTSLALRNQAFGSGLDFAWGSKENDRDYAVRESTTSVKLYKNFKERPGGGLNVGFQAEGLSPGPLLGVKGQGGISFFDWATGKLVRRIEVEPRTVYWSESDMVALACEDTFYVLRFSRDAYNEALANGEVDEDGVEAAFEVVTDQAEAILSASWIGDCLVYTNSANRLNYLVGEKVYSLSHFDERMYILGYLARDGRVYLCNKDVQVVSFALSLSLVEFQTLVLRDELETAMEMLSSIPEDQMGKIARFLEAQDYKEEALQVATDPEHRFDLALGLGCLTEAVDIARTRDEPNKWRQVGDAALTSFDLALAEECFTRAKDLGALLLMYSASGDPEGLRRLADRAKEASALNVLFDCLWLLRDIPAIVELLKDSGVKDIAAPPARKPEAVLFALTYAPSLAPSCVAAWKADLELRGKGRVSRAVGVPPGAEGLDADEELFPHWDAWLEREKTGGFAEDEDETPVEEEEDEAGEVEDVEEEEEDEDGAEEEEEEE